MSNNDRISEVYKGEIWTDDAQDRARRRIHWIAGQARGDRVLDIGCSQGITSILLGREGFEVIGIDIEASRIEYAQADLALESEETRARVTFSIGNAAELEYEESSFDTVLLGEVIEHLVAPERVLSEVVRVLRPGGVAVLTTPFGFLHHHDHKQTFFPTDLLALLSPYFGIVSAEIGDRYFRIVGEKGAETDPTVLDMLQEQADGVVRDIQAELLDVRNRAHRLALDLERATSSATTAEKRLGQVETQISRSESLRQRAERERDNVQKAWRETKAKLAQTSAELKTASEQAKGGERAAEELRKARKRLLKQDRDLARVRHRLELSDWKLASLRQRRWWRLGTELGEVRRRPRSLFTLPVRLMRVLRSKPLALPRPVQPGFERRSSEQGEPGSLTQPIIPRHDVVALALIGPELERLLGHEIQLFKLEVDSWRDQISSLAPHLLIADPNTLTSTPIDFAEILDSARAAGVKTVLWDDEQSATAGSVMTQFDLIVGSEPAPSTFKGRMVDRIGSIQPMIHNPIGAKRAQDSAAVDLSGLVLADTSFATMTELALASKDFKILRSSKPENAPNMAALAATAIPIISLGTNDAWSLGTESEEEALALERSLLKSEVLRARLTHPRMREAIREFSIGSVVDAVLNDESQAWPQIDVMAATKRPEKLEFLFENLGRQTYPNFRVFLVAHGVQFDEEKTRSLAERAGVRLAAITHVPESVILGEVFNIGFGETEAGIVAKVDDDDIYGPEYLWDLYSALEFSGAEVAGKWAHYAYLEGPDALVYRYRDFEHRFTEVVAISTLLMRREVLEVERFPEMPWGSGSMFLRALGAQGGRVFAADRWNYLYIRGQDGDRNTFPISDLRLLSVSDVICRGMNVEEIVL
jgi:ubiquinone/menaquinone biosynthesis C-methylase UbiE